jgi:hypothetical protein
MGWLAAVWMSEMGFHRLSLVTWSICQGEAPSFGSSNHKFRKAMFCRLSIRNGRLWRWVVHHQSRLRHFHAEQRSAVETP